MIDNTLFACGIISAILGFGSMIYVYKFEKKDNEVESLR